MTLTNKYLEKIAASRRDEGDAAKAFAQTSAAGYAGHGVGAVLGGVGLGLLAAKNKRVGSIAARAVEKSKSLISKVTASRPGKFIGKHMGGGGPAGVVGGVVGGFAGEEAAQYAATRHSIIKTKKQEQ